MHDRHKNNGDLVALSSPSDATEIGVGWIIRCTLSTVVLRYGADGAADETDDLGEQTAIIAIHRDGVWVGSGGTLGEESEWAMDGDSHTPLLSVLDSYFGLNLSIADGAAPTP